MSALARRALLALLLGAAIPPVALAAQPSSDLAAGARIRVHVAPPGEWREGTLVRADSQRVVLRSGGMSLAGESLVTIRRTAVRDVQVARGRSGGTWRKVVGATLGVAAGVGLAVLGTSGSCCPEDYGDLVSVPLAGIVGGIVGSVVAAKTAPRRWVPATLPPTIGAVRVGLHGGALAAPRPS